MVIDQRNAGASVNATNNTYCLDRWNMNSSVGGTYYSVQQNAGSVTPPTGFTYYLGVTSVSSITVSGTDSFTLNQRIEGYNIADLAWGTANAKTVTLSFWVRSSLTGTFGGAVSNGALDRSYPFTYTISSANTWTQASVTIVGDTSGTWATTNTTGMFVWFSLGVGSTYTGTAGAWAGSGYRSATGSTSVVATNGATLYLTGVQLEVGSTATNFDVRSYGTELQLCQRYYWQISGDTYTYIAGKQQGTTECYFGIQAPVPMRATPTPTMGAGNKYVFGQGGVIISSSTTVTVLSISNNYIFMPLSLGGFSGLSDNYVATFRTDAALQFSSEL
jgi:hypothetical protein